MDGQHSRKIEGLEKENIREKSLVFSFIEVLRENPEVFYTEGARILHARGNYINYKPNYREEKGLIREKKNNLERKIDQVLSEIIEDSMSDLHKELMIHDYIVATTEYDMRIENIDTMPRDSYNAYGALINKKAVCQGYAETLKILLNRVGIDSIIVSSKEMNHAWNIVTIDGQDYHVDATYNDPIPDVSGRILYEFFNLSDKDMRETHVWNYGDYPRATSNKYSRLRNVEKRDYLGNHVYFLLRKEGSPSLYKLNLISKKKERVVDSLVDDFRIEGDMIYYLDRNTGREEIIETQPKREDGFENFLPSHGIIPNSNWQMRVAGAASKDLINNPYGYRIEGLDAKILGEKNIRLAAYNIEDNNFFKLRDLAAIFSGSEKGFEVSWNEDKKSIELISGQTYTSLGNEFEKPRGRDIRVVRNSAKIYKDGRELELEAYNIAGNNYFKLRDITQIFNIGTDWDGNSNSIIMDSLVDYIN